MKAPRLTVRFGPPPPGVLGITGALRALDVSVTQAAMDPDFAIAAVVLFQKSDRASTMRALVDEVHRSFIYVPGTLNETLRVAKLGEGGLVDADEMCLLVAVMARAIGIPCRFVGARYGRSWTCLLDYQDERDVWITIDTVRRQFPVEQEPDERV